MAADMSQLGKYRILEEIGAGGFATVYKAVDTTLDREVALKILHPPLLADRRFVQNFRQEAKTLAALRHPHIITIYEIGEIDDRIFIAMDLARGISLSKAIAARQRIDWSATIALLKPVCDALDYAHEQSVVHRDLKPANILIDKQRGALLTDFGFAKLLAGNAASMTMSGGIVGTPGYIAPEVWESNATDAPVDIYALGCVVYEMLTGDVLFKGQTPIQTMRAHDRGPQLPATWPNDVPAMIATVLAKALAHDPGERYASASALWQALKDMEAQTQALRSEAQRTEAAKQTAARNQEQAKREAEQRVAVAAQWQAEAEKALDENNVSLAKMALGRWRAVTPDDPTIGQIQQRLEQLLELQIQKETISLPDSIPSRPPKVARPEQKSKSLSLSSLFVVITILICLLGIIFQLRGKSPTTPVPTTTPAPAAPTAALTTAPAQAAPTTAPTAPIITPSLSSISKATSSPTATLVPIEPAATHIGDSKEKQLLEFGIISQLYNTDRERILNLTNTAGFDWVKQQVAWKDIEDSPGHYTWNQLDLIVNDTVQHKLKLLFTIAQTPPFYTPDGQSGLPQDPKALGNFVEALVKRYGGKIQAYEIWEEQNLAVNNGGHVTVDDAGHYVDILVECFNRIKAINPNITVVAGAVASTAANNPSVAVSDEKYYQAMYRYKNGIIKDYFDVQAVRLYGSANPPETIWPDNPSNAEGWTNDPTFYFRRIENIRKFMEESGLQRHQIWITGFGWATKNNTAGYEYGNQVSFEQQSDYITGAIRLVYQKYQNVDGTPWVGVMFLWNMNFAVLWQQRGNPEHQEASFGILNSDWTPRPAFLGLQKLLPQIKQAQNR